MKDLIFAHSPAYLLLFALLGLGYAALLYAGRGLRSQWRWGLAALRALLVLGIGLLLLGPMLRLLRTQREAPVVVLAVDNSQSLPLAMGAPAASQAMQQVLALAQPLRQAGYAVVVQALQGNPPAGPGDSVRFTARSSDLSGLLQRSASSLQGRAVAGLVLASDGIANRGLQPEYLQLPFPVHTVGLGDTVPYADLSIAGVQHNRLAYLRNRFPLQVQVGVQGMASGTATLQLLEDGKELARTTLPIAGPGLLAHTFTLQAQRPGRHHYVLQVQGSQPERLLANNTRHVYIEVLDARQKVLLAAAAPHPDIKALRAALEGAENIELDIYVPGIAEQVAPRYDLIILHQLPRRGAQPAPLQGWLASGTPLWFIAGSQADVAAQVRASGLGTWAGAAGAADEVMAELQPDFGAFALSQVAASRIPQLPPLQAPYGQLAPSAAASTLLGQRVGSVSTGRPLLLAGSPNGRRTALLCGTGLWRWRLGEYADHENHEATDELLRKLVQYLGSKDDKSRFRLNPVAPEVDEGERPSLLAECYDELYQPIFGQTISLSLKPERGPAQSFRWVHTQASSTYALPPLPAGAYTYAASTQLGGSTLRATGSLVVRQQALEAQNTRADHGLLRELSQRSGGRHVPLAQLPSLAQQLAQQPAVPVLHTQEELQEILAMPWLLALLLALPTLEWLLRKLRGGY